MKYLDLLRLLRPLPWLLCLAAWPAAAQPLVLDAAAGGLGAWPAVKVLADPTRAMEPEQVPARRADSTTSQVPRANFGVCDEALGLSVPLRLSAQAAGPRVLSVACATLDRIDLYVLAAGQPVRHVELGRKLLDSFRQPVIAAGQPCPVGPTIGHALAPLDGQDASSRFKRADAATYAGRQVGRSGLRRGQASVGLAGAWRFSEEAGSCVICRPEVSLLSSSFMGGEVRL